MGDTKLLAKLSEGNMIAREVCYCEQCMKKFRNKFSKFPNNKKKIILKTFRKISELLQLPSVCHLLKILWKVVMKLNHS